MSASRQALTGLLDQTHRVTIARQNSIHKCNQLNLGLVLILDLSFRIMILIVMLIVMQMMKQILNEQAVVFQRVGI